MGCGLISTVVFLVVFVPMIPIFWLFFSVLIAVFGGPGVALAYFLVSGFGLGPAAIAAGALAGFLASKVSPRNGGDSGGGQTGVSVGWRVGDGIHHGTTRDPIVFQQYLSEKRTNEWTERRSAQMERDRERRLRGE